MTSDALPLHDPRVSVLMTIYNAAPFLKESIDSLIAQSFTHWELIAVENGSIDDSPSILGSYTDARIRKFPFPENIGRTPALRHALDRARGEYVAVLDADDVAHLERFAKQVRFLDERPEVVLVGSWAEYVDDDGQAFDRWEPPTDHNEVYDCLGWFNPIVHSSVMYRRKDAMAAEGYPSEFSYGQDLALIMRLAPHGQLAIIPEYLCKLRASRGRLSNSSRFQTLINYERLQLLRSAPTRLLLSQSGLRRNRRAIATAEINYGIALLKAKSVLKGLKSIFEGVRRDQSALWMNSVIRKRLGMKDWRGGAGL